MTPPPPGAVADRAALDLAELRRIVDDRLADRDHWAPLVAAADPVEERTCVLLDRTGDVEVWLLVWNEGADTGLHDHGDAGAVIGVAQGAVLEDRLTTRGLVSRVLAEGDRVGVPRHGIHRVAFAEGRPAVTIHAYSPPLTTMGAYVEGEDGELRRYLVDGAEELSTVAS